MSKLRCEGIVKTYSGKDVLKNVDLELESGKIYGLIGRNGAGKTTLLSILTSQNPASAGTVTFDGQPVWENQEVLDNLCFARELNTMVNGQANSMKVKDYLRVASVYLPHWDKEMAKRLIAEFELDVKKRINKLSKGMLSMVTIIVALASKAPFTILDEPVAGLDVVMRERFYQLLVEEYTETGRTFVISTHIIEEAADVFEEVIIIDRGRIVLKENTQELLDRCYHVSGMADAVDAATISFETHHKENYGRSKSVMVMLKPGEEISDKYDVTVQPMNLQKVFVGLCGKEES